jgi:RimJ/RimL family protein N-acetyltransferase
VALGLSSSAVSFPAKPFIRTALDSFIGVGRLNRIQGTQEAEAAVIVTDQYQNRGLGAELLRRVIYVARKEGLRAVCAEMMPGNLAMLAITKSLGFKVKMHEGFDFVSARLEH